MKKKTVITAIVGLCILIIILIIVLVVVLTSDSEEPEVSQVTTPVQQTQDQDETSVQFVEDNDMPSVTDEADETDIPDETDVPDDAPMLTDPDTVVAQFGDRTYTVADITNS